MSKKKDYLRSNRLDYSHFFTSDEESPDDSLPPEAKFPLGRRKRIFDFIPARQKARKSIIDRAFPKAPEGADVDPAAPTSKPGRKRVFQMPEQRQTVRKPIIDRNFNNLISSTPLTSAQKTFNKSVPLSPIALEHPQHAHMLKTPVHSSLPPDTEKVKPSSRSIRVQTDFPYVVGAPDDAPVGRPKGERVGEVNRAHSVMADESSEENTLVEMMLAKADEVMERRNNNEEDDSDESSSKISWLSALLREHNLEMNSGSSDTSSVSAKVIQKNKDVQDHHHAPKISNDIISRGHDRNEGSRQVKKSAHPVDGNRLIMSPAKVLFPVEKEVLRSQSTRHSTKNKTCRRGISVGKSIVNKQISSIRDSPCGDYDSHDTYYTKSVTEKASRVNTLCEELLRRRLSSTSKVSNECVGLNEIADNERSESPVKIPEVDDGLCVANAGNDSKSRRRESRRTISRTSTDRATENAASKKDGSKEVETSTNRTVVNILKNNKSRKRDSEVISIDKVVQNTSKSKNKRRSDAKYLERFADEPFQSTSEDDEGDEEENDEFLIDKAKAETSTNRKLENTSKNNKSRKPGNEQISTDKVVQNVSKNKKNKSRDRGNDDTYLERFADEPAKSISKNDVNREQENDEFLLGISIDKAVETTSKNKKNHNSLNRGNGEILAETSTNRELENTSKNNKSRKRENEQISTDKVVQNVSETRKTKSRERGDDDIYLERFAYEPAKSISKDNVDREQENEHLLLGISVDKAVETTSKNKKSHNSWNRGNGEILAETSANRELGNTSKNNKSRKRDNEEISTDKVVQNVSMNKKNKSMDRGNDDIYLERFADEPAKSISKNNVDREQENEDFLLGISIDKAVRTSPKNKKNHNSLNRGNGEILAETSTNRMVENTSKNNKSRKRDTEEISTDKVVQNVSKNKKNKSMDRGNDDIYLERFADEPAKSISKNNVDREQENEDFLLGISIDKAVVETTSKNKKNHNSWNRGNGDILAETSTNRMVENTSKNNKSRKRENEQISTDKIVQNVSKNKKNKSRERGNDDTYLERFADEPEKSTSKDHEGSEKENEDFSELSIHKPVETTSKNKKNRGNTEIFPETSIKNTSKNDKSRREENIETFLEILADNPAKNTKSKKKNNNHKKGGNNQVLQATCIDKSVKYNPKKDKSTERREHEETVREICTHGAIDNTSKSEENNCRGKRRNKEISPETFGQTDGPMENTSKIDKSRRRENDISYSEDRSIEDDVSPLLNKDKSQYKCRKKKLKGDTSTSGLHVPNRPSTSCSKDRDKSIENSGQGEKNKKIVILSNNILDATPDMPLDKFLFPAVPDPANDDLPNERSRTSTKKVKTSTITDKTSLPNGVIKKRGQRTKLFPETIVEDNNSENGPRRSKRQPKPRKYAYIPAVIVTHDARLLKGNSSSQSTILAGAKWLNLKDPKTLNSLSTDSRSTRTKTIKRDTKKTSTVPPTSEAAASSREHEMAETTSYATNLPSSIAEEPKGEDTPLGVEDGTLQQQTDEEGLSVASLRSDYKKRPYTYFPKNNKLRRIDSYLWPDIEWKPIGNGEDMRIGRGCKSAQAGFQNGYLEILPGKSKPKEMTSNCAVTFFVLEGECWYQVHDSYDFAPKYSNFQVPLGAIYSIINASKTERLLLAYTKVQGPNHSD